VLNNTLLFWIGTKYLFIKAQTEAEAKKELTSSVQNPLMLIKFTELDTVTLYLQYSDTTVTW